MEKGEVHCFIDEIKKASKEKNLYQFGKNIGIAKCMIEYSSVSNKKQLMQSILIEEIIGLYNLKEFEKMVAQVDHALDIVEDYEVRMQLLHKKGAALAWLGQLSEALNIFEELTGEMNSKIRIWALNSISWVYLLKYQRELNHDYLDLAETYARDGIDDAKDVDQELYVISLRNLGNVYWDSKKYEKALSVFLEVNDIYKGENAKALNNVAATYVSLGNIGLAKEFLHKAEDIAERDNNDFELGQCYFIYGRIEEEILDQYIQAKDYYLAAFDYYITAKTFEEAVKTYKRILSLDRGINEDALSFLAQKLATQFKKEIA